MPVSAASCDERLASPRSGTACSRPCCGRAAASAGRCSGTAWRSAASRSHGSSERNRSATSYVAPPQASSDHSCGRHPGDVAGDREQVAGAHPGREQRLVRVAERGVGDRDPVLLAQPPGEPLRPELEQQLPGAVGRGHPQVDVGQLGRRVEVDRRRAVRLVDGHVGEVGQQLGAAVAGAARGQQLRVGLDERRGDPPGRGSPGRRAPPAGTGCWWRRRGSGTPRPPAGPARPPSRRSRPRQVSLASIESKCAETSAPVYVVPPSRRTPAPPGERYVVILPVSGRKPLAGSSVVIRHCSAAPRSWIGVLGQPEVGQRLAGRDPQLGLHQVDVGDLLGHGVLDLDPRVHLDEDVVAVAGRAGTRPCRRCGSRSRGRTAPRRRTSGPAAPGRGWAPARSRRPSGGGAAPSSRARRGGSRRPSPSARICTSMCRGSTTACSMKTVGSPNAPSASRMQASTASRSRSGSSTRRMPRPPPPATALTNSGNGSSSAAATSASTSVDGSDALQRRHAGRLGRRDRAGLVAGQRRAPRRSARRT